MEGRPGLMISSENGCRGSGRRSQARPMRRASSRGRLYHGIERIHGGNDDQIDGLSFLLRQRHDPRK